MFGLRNMACALIAALVASLALFCIEVEPFHVFGINEPDSPSQIIALSTARSGQKNSSRKSARQIARSHVYCLGHAARRLLRLLMCLGLAARILHPFNTCAPPRALRRLFTYIYINRPQMAPPGVSV